MVAAVKAGRVKNAAMEESSNRIWFNMHSQSAADVASAAADASATGVTATSAAVSDQLADKMEAATAAPAAPAAPAAAAETDIEIALTSTPTAAVAAGSASAATPALAPAPIPPALTSPPSLLPPSPTHASWRSFLVSLGPPWSSLVRLPADPPFAYVSRRIHNDESFLLPLLITHNVRVASVPGGGKGGKRGAGGARGAAGEVRFEDVAGVDEAKRELMELVQGIKGAGAFAAMGAHIPKGVLLIGPPGTGKTLLARVVAAEADVPFFAASASEFVEMFVGRGAARVRELFREARKAAPAIVFIDEIDAVGARRGASSNDERDQTLNQLLTELDGFDSPDDGVLLLAATNRLDTLDPATVVARYSEGFSGADLENVVNEAAWLAARSGEARVSLDHFLDAVERTRNGIGITTTTTGLRIKPRARGSSSSSSSSPLLGFLSRALGPLAQQQEKDVPARAISPGI
ncbi:unnamed protein product [Closterium sp. NIES-64]|nr:unnamed protein product [Closterium sp. NIES-64]